MRLAFLLSLLLATGAAAEVFGPEQVIDPAVTGARHIVMADIDGDGDDDVLLAAFGAGTITWFDNQGQGSFGSAVVIDAAAAGARGVAAADLDRDGDLDVVACSELDDTVAWHENTDGVGTFTLGQTLTTAAAGARSVFPADIDRDGDLDVLTASAFDDTLGWYENLDGAGTFGSLQSITTTAGGATDILAADLDRDGDLDALAAAYDDDTVAWYENTDGQGSFGPAQVLSSGSQGALSVRAVDLDGDGDLDVLAASELDDTVAWFRSEGGDGTFSSRRVISIGVDGASTAVPMDVDRDGDLDVLATASGSDEVVWMENTDGKGSFGGSQGLVAAAIGARSALGNDLDRDGDLDLVVASESDGTLAWYQNESIHLAAAWTRAGGRINVVSHSTHMINESSPADMDGDRDLDILVNFGSEDLIGWYENLDGLGSFGPREIALSGVNARGLMAVDLDGDSDPDAIWTYGSGDPGVAWAENIDGLGTLGPPQTIATALFGFVSILDVGDIDGDGDPDILARQFNSADGTDTLVWYENDSTGSFAPQQIILASPTRTSPMLIVDLDDDGDGDLLGSISAVEWFENDGTETFAAPKAIAVEDASHFLPVDLDGDGDLDVLTGGFVPDGVAWHEHLDGAGSFGPRQPIGSNELSINRVLAADVDVDGDLDVLSTAFSGKRVHWYANLDGAGRFGPRRILKDQAAFDATAADVDGDGDVDLFSLRLLSALTWSENDGRGNLVSAEIHSSSHGQAMELADIDRQGGLDVIWSVNSDSRWQRNFGGTGVFTTSIGFATFGVDAIAVADIDRDGDPDVISGESLGPNQGVHWWDNTTGAGGFFTLGQELSPLKARDVEAGDVDRDGDADIVASGESPDEVGWYQNDGSGGFSAVQPIGSLSSRFGKVFLADLDGDADEDAVTINSNGDLTYTTSWYENTDGLGAFGSQQIISPGAIDLTSDAADLDRDGDLDVLASNAWYENMDGAGTFGMAQTFDVLNAAVRSTQAADVDLDGDLDLIARVVRPDDSRFVGWYENLGDESFAMAQPLSRGQFSPANVGMGDMNRDGKIDVVSNNSFGAMWYANRSGAVVLRTTSAPGQVLPLIATVELFRFEVSHLGRPGDAAAALASVAIMLTRPPPPDRQEPMSALSSAAVDALIGGLSVYRDDGSGAWEPSADPLLVTVGSEVFTQNLGIVPLPEGDPESQIDQGDTGLFFVVAQMSPAAGGVGPFVARHVSSRSEVHHEGTSVVLDQQPGRGTQPNVMLVPEPSVPALLTWGIVLVTCLRRSGSNR